MFPGPRCQPHRSRGVLPCPSPACYHSDRIASSLGDCSSEHTVSLYSPPRLVGRTLPVEDGLVDDGALVPAPAVSREGAVYSSSFKPADHPKIALPLFRLPGDRQPRDTAVPALRKQKHQNTPFFSSFPEMSFQGFPTRRVKRVKKGELLLHPVETPLSLCLGQYKHQEHLVFCS